jgi:hypothetical protein
MSPEVGEQTVPSRQHDSTWYSYFLRVPGLTQRCLSPLHTYSSTLACGSDVWDDARRVTIDVDKDVADAIIDATKKDPELAMQLADPDNLTLPKLAVALAMAPTYSPHKVSQCFQCGV